ncbi:MAG: DnaD domain protein [Bacilli bacterium]
MEKIKELIKAKPFIINEFLLKNVVKLNITLNEFLLILYFINIDLSLNVDDIKLRLGITEEDILNTFNSLCEKKLIEVKISSINNKMEETISLDILYDKLILSIDDKKEVSDIYSTFETELGRTLSPIEYETINNWLENGIDEKTIKRALKEAVLNGVSNLRYIDKILYEWSKKNADNTLENTSYNELFDYDWLGESHEK